MLAARAEAFYHVNYSAIKGHGTRLGAQRRPGRSHGAEYCRRLWARFRERQFWPGWGVCVFLAYGVPVPAGGRNAAAEDE
jgi:hypothetical protein